MQRDYTLTNYYEIEIMAIENDYTSMIKVYYSFLKSYLDMYHGIYSGPAVLDFLSLFGKHNLKIIEKNKNLNLQNSYYNFKKTNIEYEDYAMEVITLFMKLVSRYRNTGGLKFSFYLKRSFHYNLLQNLKKYTFLNKVDTYSYKFNLSIQELSLFEDVENKIDEPSTIDCNWIFELPNTRFKNLNNIQRQIILEYYINKNTDSQLAQKFGLCRATINRIRKKAKQNIQLKDVL